LHQLLKYGKTGTIESKGFLSGVNSAPAGIGASGFSRMVLLVNKERKRSNAACSSSGDGGGDTGGRATGRHDGRRWIMGRRTWHIFLAAIFPYMRSSLPFLPSAERRQPGLAKTAGLIAYAVNIAGAWRNNQ